MSHNPYQSPVETSVSEFSAKNIADVGPQHLGWFINVVLFLDTIPNLIRLYIEVDELINSIRYPGSLASIDWLNLSLSITIPFFGLSGNILVLLKKRIGIPLAIISIVLSMLGWGIGLWTLVDVRWHILSIVEVLLIALVIWSYLWLFLFSIVIWKAAKKLGWLQRRVGPKE